MTSENINKLLEDVLRDGRKDLIVPELLERATACVSQDVPDFDLAIECLEAALRINPKLRTAEQLLELCIKKQSEELLERDVTDLRDDQINFLFDFLLGRGLRAPAFGEEDTKKIETINIKRQLIKDYKGKRSHE